MTERQLMERAVALARKSQHEDDRRVHPWVGAVVARNEDELLSEGYRRADGVHAEVSALSQLRDDVAAGATVYTTLEPCTERKTHTPCTLALLKYGIRRVVIGMLDPNRDIRGQGEWLLEDHGIEIGKFPADLVRQIRTLNREFIDYQLGLGFVIKSPQNGETISVDQIRLEGTCRTHPRPGDNIVVLSRSDFTYYPQAPIAYDRDRLTWQCQGFLWYFAKERPVQYEIIVARVSEDLAFLVRHYSRVHEACKERFKADAWIGLNMPTRPPGLEVLASITITRSAKA
jgi:pyrimidine deaminase RibD-like protein